MPLASAAWRDGYKPDLDFIRGLSMVCGPVVRLSLYGQ